jgi:hypothetical protein
MINLIQNHTLVYFVSEQSIFFSYEVREKKEKRLKDVKTLALTLTGG